MPGLCYPYGSGIECTCSIRGTPVQCVPVLDYEGGFYQEGEYTVGDVGDYTLGEEGEYSLVGKSWIEAADELTPTKIILLITLVLIILLSCVV